MYHFANISSQDIVALVCKLQFASSGDIYKIYVKPLLCHAVHMHQLQMSNLDS